jgi:hypothetical protein
MAAAGLVSTQASAAPVIFTDTIDFTTTAPTAGTGHQSSNGYFMSAFGVNDRAIYSHDIADDGYNSTDYTISSALLKISFVDDEDFCLFGVCTPEAAEIDLLGLLSGSPFQPIDTGTYGFNLLGLALLDIMNDGDLNVQLEAVVGDFYVTSSQLTVVTDQVAVPEPGLLGLLGLGLVGMGLRSRKS